VTLFIVSAARDPSVNTANTGVSGVTNANGPCLSSPRRTLGVVVRNLFELQRALQRHGHSQRTPDEEERLAVAVLAGGLPHLVFLVKHLLDRARETAQIL